MLHMTKILRAPFTVHLTNVPITNYNKLLNQFLHFFELFDSLPAFFFGIFGFTIVSVNIIVEQ